jgi:hypothetical protein
VTFSPGPPTHLHTYTPLAFKHAAEKQISNAHFKREFTFILTYSLFYGMDLVAPGPTFSRQELGKSFFQEVFFAKPVPCSGDLERLGHPPTGQWVCGCVGA